MGGFNIRDIMDPSRFRTSRNNSPSKPPSTPIAIFPPEILAHILSNLEGRDIAAASRVCKSFYTASLIDSVWQARWQREFKVTNVPGQINTMNPTFYKDFYIKVLHKYGHLIGDWQPEITHYGGLVEIKFENGKLIGIEWQATRDPKTLRRNNVFSIGLDDDGQLEILCLRGYLGPHNCQITIKDGSCFNAKCCVPDSHRHPGGNDVEIEEWSRLGGVPLNSDLLMMKFLHIKKYVNSFDFRRLSLPAIPTVKPIIQPGYFQGLYGDHGVEIIALNYEQDGVLAKAVKITGDPNVPYGKVTFRIDLRCSMVLTEAEQRTIELLQQHQELPRTSTNVQPHNLPMQSFVVPTGCSEYGLLHNLPNTCRARFAGCAQIAGHGYTNNSYTHGQWIVFNENLFAFIFLELSSISIYHRCQRDYAVN